MSDDNGVVGGFDIECVSLDLSDPNNRILTIAIWGDLHLDGIVLGFDDEGKTIEAFAQEANPYSALIGWNSDSFDLPLLAARLQRFSVDLGDCGLPLILDGMRIHEHVLRKLETSYTLDHVAKKHLKEGKIPFDRGLTLETFEKDREALAAYNLQDARLVYLLNKQFGYFDTFDAITKRAGLDEYNTRKFAGISQKTDGGFAWWRPLMGLVTKYCKAKGLPVPEWPSDTQKSLRSQETVERPGGFVEEPLPGHHKNVMEFDFASLYPSLIRTFNLGADSADENGEIRPPFGRYVPATTHRAMVAAILDELVDERGAVKKEYEARKDAGATTEELAALKGRTEALKILLNSFYGQYYAIFSPLYHYNSAKNITTLGQKCVKMMLSRMREMGFEVIAGDTDSTYVRVPPEKFNKESALSLSAELTKYVSEKLREEYGVEFVGSFDFKSLISDFYIEKKKFYARLDLGKPVSEIEIKGYVRGNTPELQRVAQRRVFETMFSGGDVKAMLAEARAKFLSGKDHTIFLQWMRVHTGRNTAQAKALLALIEAGVVFQKFEQVGFLLVGTGKKQRRIAAHALPDSTVEWMWMDEKVLRRNTDFLTTEEAERMFDAMVNKLDGVEIAQPSNTTEEIDV
jgi:DNA polymerase-2